MNSLTALENLIKAVHSGDAEAISAAVEDGKDTLGYDPINPDFMFEVSLTIDYDDKTPEGAVKQFIDSVRNNDLMEWVYVVVREDGAKFHVDPYAEKFSVYPIS